MKKIMMIMGVGLMTLSLNGAEQTTIPFDEAHWTLSNAGVLEFQGRQALMGTAMLKDAAFENGVIEYDQYVSGGRSYPGVMFRSQPDGSWERFYIRPHRSGRVAPSLYSDVLQYVPAWNRIDSWQLYSGPGYTAGSVIPVDRWFHVRIEVAGTRMRVFIDNRPQAELEVPNLLHGRRKGGIMLNGPADGSAYYSHFSYRADDRLDLGPARRSNEPVGFIKKWQVSQSFPTLKIDESGPGFPVPLGELKWRDLEVDDEGRLDIGRIQGRSGQPDAVFLRTLLSAQRDEIRPIKFGYSDNAILFLNGQKIVQGDSMYQGRDPSFLGILGLSDTVFLPLRSGDNELIVMLSESQGGWGFTMQEADYEKRADGLNRLWQTGKVLAVHQDHLYALEARALVDIDLTQKKILKRTALPGALRANDVIGNGKDALWVSDPQSVTIFRIHHGQAEAWLRGPEVVRPNGLALQAGRLLFVNNGDGWLKAADLETRTIAKVADIAGGLGDGLAVMPSGAVLVSHNEGRLLSVDAAGTVKVLMDLIIKGQKIADFCLIPEKNIIVCPTFDDMRQAAESLGGDSLLNKTLSENEAIVWYLGHCGYAVKTKSKLLIFDYQEKVRLPDRSEVKPPARRSLFNGWVDPEEIKDLDVLVFASHSHSDHYDDVIFTWEKIVKKIAYIFGWQEKDGGRYHSLPAPRGALTIDGVEIITVNSHHSGVPESGFLVKLDGLTLFHQGDYIGRMGGDDVPFTVTDDLKYLKAKHEKIDLFFSHAGTWKPQLEMMESFRPQAVFPMHYGYREEKYLEYESEVKKLFKDIKFFIPRKKGNFFHFNRKREGI